MAAAPQVELCARSRLLSSLTGRSGAVHLGFRERLVAAREVGREARESRPRPAIGEKETQGEDLDLTGDPLQVQAQPRS